MVDAGGCATILQADLRDPEQISVLFDRVDEAFPTAIEMLVNNAGEWMDRRPILDCSLKQWDSMFRMNTQSVFLCCQQAVRRMSVSGQGGAIVNIGSLAGHTGGNGGTVPYAAAKAAVHTFTRGLAKELAQQNIRVNAVAPGMVNTPMLHERVSAETVDAVTQATPMARFGIPEELVAPVLMLLSPGASYITGQILDVNGGLLMR
jgi:NAD(P)-dependent dehydrogenase (short-subunit alcohol dehydrogenase family)